MRTISCLMIAWVTLAGLGVDLSDIVCTPSRQSVFSQERTDPRLLMKQAPEAEIREMDRPLRDALPSLKDTLRYYDASCDDFSYSFWSQTPTHTKAYNDRIDIKLAWGYAVEIKRGSVWQQIRGVNWYAERLRCSLIDTKQIPGPRVAGLPLPFRLRDK